MSDPKGPGTPANAATIRAESTIARDCVFADTAACVAIRADLKRIGNEVGELKMDVRAIAGDMTAIKLRMAEAEGETRGRMQVAGSVWAGLRAVAVWLISIVLRRP